MVLERCWLASRPGGTYTPTRAPRWVSPAGFAESRESLRASPDSGGSRELGAILAVLPSSESRQWGHFCSVKWVLLTWLPVWKSRIYSPLVCLSSLRWRLSKASACLCKGKSDHLSTTVKLSFSKDFFISFCLLASPLWADTHTNPLILVCGSTRLWERERKRERATPSTSKGGRRESSWEREKGSAGERERVRGAGWLESNNETSTVNRSEVDDQIFIVLSPPSLFPFYLFIIFSFSLFRHLLSLFHSLTSLLSCITKCFYHLFQATFPNLFY